MNEHGTDTTGTDTTGADTTRTVIELCHRAFGRSGPDVISLTDVNRGRGAFSVVLRAELQWQTTATPAGGATAAAGHDQPSSAVAKLPMPGPNGAAAVASGAYRREALAYRELLVEAVVQTPAIYAIEEPGDGTCSILMEDLSNHRHIDQLDGLPTLEAVTIATDLARFHQSWAVDTRLPELPVRRNTIAMLPEEGLRAGLSALETTWVEDLNGPQRKLFSSLVNGRDRLVARFERQTPTLCHGDPRADNLVFDRSGRTILFDWQQMAVQFGEADLAWLSATSLDTTVRRQADEQLVAAYGTDMDRYRLGLALPGLTVLLLAQRQTTNERTRRFVSTSLQRIAAAVEDLDVAGLA